MGFRFLMPLACSNGIKDWCEWGVAVVCLDGIGRESERVEIKGESLRKVLTFPTILKINNGLNGYNVTGTGHWHHDFQFLQLTELQFLERHTDHRIIGLFSLSHEQNLTFRLSERKIKLAWSFPIVRKVNEVKLALIMPWREDKGVCQFRRI